MQEKAIPRNEGGVRTTCLEIVCLAREGAARPELVLQIMAGCLLPRALDDYFRRKWNYVDDGPVELLRTVDLLLSDLKNKGKFQGDCDDACIIAAATLLTIPKIHRGYPGFYPETAAVCAVRSPHDTAFSHVFILLSDHQGFFRIDPTAPTDADYQNWETLTVKIF